MTLANYTICLTRRPEQSTSLTAVLTAEGAHVVSFPTIRLAPPPDESIISQAINELASYDWLVFTSVNAVEHFFTYSQKLVRDTPLPKVAAVGPATERALAHYGITPALTPQDFRAEGLIAAFETVSAGEAGKRILFPRALVGRDILSEELTDLGYELTLAPVYQTLPVVPTSTALAELVSPDGSPRVDALVFTSPSTARNFVSILHAAGMDALPLMRACAVFSLGPVTTQELIALGLEKTNLHEAPQSTSDALADTIIQHFTPSPV